MDYGPVGVAGVPTLSEWAMIAMALVVGVAAVIALRKQASSKAVMSLTIGAAALLTAALGGTVGPQAWAIIAPQMTNPAGGSTQVPFGIGVVPVQNTTQVPLRIINVTPTDVLSSPATTCDPGVVVAPGASCDVDTGSPPT